MNSAIGDMNSGLIKQQAASYLTRAQVLSAFW